MNEVNEALGAVCVLHGGTEKTGSTSLQRFLALNAAELACQSIWVPRCLVPDPVRGPYNHTLLITSSRLSIDEPDDLQAALGLTTMEDVARHRQEIIRALALEYAELGFIPSKIIVSSEHVHSRLKSCEDLENAKALLQPYCGEFEVFVYLREQADLAQSLAITSVRSGATELRQIPDFSTPNGFDPFLGVDFNYFDYASLLERLGAVFGEAALRVRLYERAELRNNNVIDDFFDQIDLNIQRWRRPERENPGLNLVAALFLVHVNKQLTPKEEFVEVRSKIIDVLNQKYAGSLPTAPDLERNKFMMQFFKSNAVVRRRWFPGRQSLFRRNIKASMEESPPLDLSMDDVFQKIFSDVSIQSELPYKIGL